MKAKPTSLGRTKKRADWLKLIDLWLESEYPELLPWEWSDVMAWEGGYGDTKIKSVEEAVKPENKDTWPGIWFGSGQSDLSIYRKPHYVYSLLFGRQISSGTITLVSKHIQERAVEEEWEHGAMVVDWGGSIFTSVDLIDLCPAIEGTCIVNFPSPQMEFARWWLDENVSPIGLFNEGDRDDLAEYTSAFEGPLIFLFSEVLEHEKKPVVYLDLIRKDLPLVDLYCASSFCTPAYGHYIPIYIDGEDCYTVRVANSRFRRAMHKRGYRMEKVEGWNSRLWWLQL